MAPDVRLFTHPISHYSVSAERMLAYKGIRFRPILAPYHDRQELLRVTGPDYLPALVWDGQVVTWKEIPSFLDRQRPEPALLPGTVAGVARALENWGHQVVEERVWRAVVTEIPPVLAPGVERWVFEEMQTRARGSWEVLVGRREEFRRDLEEYFGLVDGLVEGREWILGPASVADFGIYGSLSPWWTAGHATPPKYRALLRWADRIRRLGPAPRRTPPATGRRSIRPSAP